MADSTRPHLVVLAMLAASAACDDPAAPPLHDHGAFTAELAGVVESTVAGAATSSLGTDPEWTLRMETPDGDVRLTFWTPTGAPTPAIGTYDLVDETTADGSDGAQSPFLVARVEVAPDAFPDYDAFDFLVGSLTITSASGVRAAGTFVLATSVRGQPTRVMTARGDVSWVP